MKEEQIYTALTAMGYRATNSSSMVKQVGSNTIKVNPQRNHNPRITIGCCNCHKPLIGRIVFLTPASMSDYIIRMKRIEASLKEEANLCTRCLNRHTIWYPLND